MKRVTSRGFVRPDTGSSLLRRVEEPDSPPATAPAVSVQPAAEPPTKAALVDIATKDIATKAATQEDIARDDIFARISTSSISLKPAVPNRRSFSNTRVGSHTTARPVEAGRQDEDRGDNVSGKISLAYSMVSVDSVDSVDTVHSVRIAEGRPGDEGTTGPALPPAAPPTMESLISRRVSSAKSERPPGERPATAGERPAATGERPPGERPATAGERPPAPPLTKKKPELKMKPKVAKVIPVVKTVSTKVLLPTGPVGFKSLPKQLHRRAIRRGFQFTLMVVGESGLGKSTLVNSMFLTDIYSSTPGRVQPAEEQTLAVTAHRLRLEEGGVRLALTVLDTPGFGDLLDNSAAWHPVASYIEEQYDKWLEAETLAVQRREVEDTRVHACLYFIPPGGHRLRQLDLEFMRRLGDKVNIVPVIGKSDTLTKAELTAFKLRINEQLKEHNITTYDFPVGPEANPRDTWMRGLAPFAVVGSNTIIQDASGKKVRGRSYPWGSVSIEDRGHCDFQALRTLLLSHSMQDLIETTSQQHYENYRTSKLKEVQERHNAPGLDEAPNKNPLASLEDELAAHTQKVLQMTADMEAVFRRKVEEKQEKMQQTEREEQERVRSGRKELGANRAELSRRREELQVERRTWERENSASLGDILLAGSTDSLGSRKKKHSMTVNPFKFGRT